MNPEELLMRILGFPTKAAGEPMVPPAAAIGDIDKPGLFPTDPGYSRVPEGQQPQDVVTPERPLTTDPNFQDVVGEPTDTDLMSILERNINSPEVWAEAQTLLEPARQQFETEAGGYREQMQNSQNDAQFIEELLAMQGGGPSAGPAAPSMVERPYINAGPGATTPYPNIPGPATNPLADPSNAFAHLDRAGPPLRPAGPQPRTIAAPPPAPTPPPGPSAPQYAHLDSPGMGFSANPAPTPPPANLAAVPQGRPGWMDTPIAPMPQNPIIGANPGGPYQIMAPPDPFGAPGNTPPPMQPAPASPATMEAARRLIPFSADRPAVMQLSERQQAGAAPLFPQPAPPPTPWRLPDSVSTPPTARPPQTPPSIRRPPPAPAAPSPAPAPLQSDILNRQELQRFMDANPMPAPAPSQPLAQPTVTPPASPPIPATAAATVPVPAPSPGQVMPIALKEQLLAEALRMTQQRRGGMTSPPAR